ncbi:MAG: radical SAM protein [Candidatus Brocadiales bacterium]|nr:radical SAM protein [Candidatus Brocadiales bacterium]
MIPKRSISNNIQMLTSTVKKIAHIPETLPKYVQISLTNYCNLSCTMCIRNYIDVDRRHMPWDDFVEIVDKLEGVEQIALAGMGESLTHPKIFDAVKYCKEKGYKVQLTSNALLLGQNDNIEKIIQSGIDSMSFSVESVSKDYELGHNNSEAARNIENLIKRKNILNSETPKVVIQPILFKEKVNDVYEVIEWAKKIGAQRVNIVRVDLRFVSNMSRPNVDEEKKIFKEFARLRKKLDFRIDCLQDQVFDGLQGFFYKHTKHLFGLDSWCYRFQDFVYIDVNGNVHPCCLDKDQIVGNLLEESLADIWRGKKFNYLRENQEKFTYCQKCDFIRLKQVA